MICSIFLMIMINIMYFMVMKLLGKSLWILLLLLAGIALVASVIFGGW